MNPLRLDPGPDIDARLDLQLTLVSNVQLKDISTFVEGRPGWDCDLCLGIGLVGCNLGQICCGLGGSRAVSIISGTESKRQNVMNQRHIARVGDMSQFILVRFAQVDLDTEGIGGTFRISSSLAGCLSIQELNGRGSSKRLVLEDSRGRSEEAEPLVVRLPFHKDDRSLCAGKDPLGLIILVQSSVLFVLFPVVKIPLGLALGDSQESVLELDASVSDVYETGLDTEELAKAGSTPSAAPLVRQAVAVLGVVLIHLEVGVADDSVLVFEVGENGHQLPDVGVSGIVDKEEERLHVSTFGCSLDPTCGLCGLGEDNVDRAGCLGIVCSGDICCHCYYCVQFRCTCWFSLLCWYWAEVEVEVVVVVVVVVVV